jgi:hypothetical protein
MEMLAEQAFNGSSPHRIMGRYSGYVLELDTRTKREQSKRQKVRKRSVGGLFRGHQFRLTPLVLGLLFAQPAP